MEDLQLLGIAKVCALLDVSDKTVDRLVKLGRLPEPRWVLGQRKWFARDVKDYLEKVKHGIYDDKPPEKTKDGKRNSGRADSLENRGKSGNGGDK